VEARWKLGGGIEGGGEIGTGGRDGSQKAKVTSLVGQKGNYSHGQNVACIRASKGVN